MANLNAVDYCVIAVYFSILVGLGLYLKGRASASLEDYFLGGRRMPWWALGISGMASFLDITGTMLVISFLYMLGPRGLYIAFRGGAVLVLAVMLLWIGKWHRRSGCMTGAEWMSYRFGEDFWGRAARILKAIAEIIWTIGMIIYMGKGIGLFLSMFLPFSPFTCALIMLSVAVVYTMLSGFYGVVFTDIFQSVIILIAVISISTLAVLKLAGHGDLAALAQTVTGNSDWVTSRLQWKTTMPKGYELYNSLGMFALFYVLRNIFHGMGYGDDPKFFGARNDRECGTLTFLWTWLMMVRWPMMIGFAVLGLFLVQRSFPDQGVLIQAAASIKEHVGPVDETRWEQVIAGIMNKPSAYPAELITRLRELLGADFSSKLPLLGYQGTVNPERILPAVILFYIPAGLRGMLLVALIAASMSTFDSNVNRGTAFFTRDLYQRFFRPKAAQRELIYASWVFIIAVAAVGLVAGNYIKNINDIWGWIIMGLGGGTLVPFFLRFYWWRFNGSGFALGMALGLTGAVAMKIATPYLIACSEFWSILEDERWQFVIALSIGLVSSFAGTFLTKPTSRKVLEHFYRTTRPFGLWGPLKGTLDPKLRAATQREHRNDLLALPFNLGWQVTLFLLPMQLVIGSFKAFWMTLPIFVVCLIGMYVFWYRNLPPAGPAANYSVDSGRGSNESC